MMACTPGSVVTLRAAPGRGAITADAGGRDAGEEPSVAIAAIPTIPDGSWPAYTAVELFLIGHHNRGDAFTPTYEELGQLVRLAADLRHDADHLAALAEDVEKLIDEGVGEIRNLEARNGYADRAIGDADA